MAAALDPSARARTPQTVRQLVDLLTTKAGIDATIPLEVPDLVDTYRPPRIPEA